MAVTAQDPGLAGDAPAEAEVTMSRGAALLRDPGRLWQYVGIPVVVAVALLALVNWIGGLELDSIEQRWLNREQITRAVLQHVRLSLWATLLVVVIAVPLGIALTRRFARPLTPLFIGLANVGQAIPSVGLLFFLALPFALGIGPRTAVVAVVAYCVLPVLRNTMVGLGQVDPALIESARGMGMTRWAVLVRIELPLAVPVVLAGVRTALILTVGTITLATFINAGGLGDVINAGLVTNRTPVLVTGGLLTASLALVIDWLAALAERLIRPRGL